MSLPLVFLTVASLLSFPQPAPIQPTSHVPRVVMVTLPHEPAGLGDEDELLFYFTESVEPVATIAPAFASSDLPCPLHATLQSLGRWLLVLLAMVFVAALLGSVAATRRPLPLAAIAVRQPSRPVPLVERLLVLACLWSPMLMLLGLLQAEREMLSSVLMCMASTGVIASGAMLIARRRLLSRLRWAVAADLGGRLSTLPDGVVVKAEIDPKRLVAPPGDAEPTPWFRADLQGVLVGGDSESTRVSLDGVVVDDEAARALVRMAMGLPAIGHLTVLGCSTRAPADASGAAPLDRHASVQARITHGPSLYTRAVLCAGSPASLARRLRSESLLLAAALAGSFTAAILTLLS